MTKARADRTIWFDFSVRGNLTLHIGGVVRIARDYGIAAMPDELVSMSATDLRHALADASTGSLGPLIISETPAEYLDEDDVLSTGVEFDVDPQGLVMRVDVMLTEWVDEEKDLQHRMHHLLGNLLTRNRCELVSAEHDWYSGGPVGPHLSHLTLRPSTRARTVAELFRFGVEVQALVDAYDGGELTRESTLNLLRAGHAAVLIGMPEGGWFDVKSQLYDIRQLKGKVSLAQAVARFANSDGGVVVFGMGTKKVGSGEVVAKIHPAPTDGHTIRRHRQTLETHVYPLPVGLDVEIVQASGGMLLVVHVPPQPDTQLNRSSFTVQLSARVPRVPSSASCDGTVRTPSLRHPRLFMLPCRLTGCSTASKGRHNTEPNRTMGQPATPCRLSQRLGRLDGRRG